MPSARILSRLFFTTSPLSKTNSSHHQFIIPSYSCSSPSLLFSSPVNPHRSTLNSTRFSSPFISSRRGLSSSRMDASGSEIEVSYIGQQAAKEIDEILMGPLGFSVDQLMELAGLSVAAAIAEVYKPSENRKVLVICGPGNNGGDGLVAARHLYHFGYEPVICYPKRSSSPLFSGLVTQLKSLEITFLSKEELPPLLSDEYDLVVDAMFGFSFRGMPREPFAHLIKVVSMLTHAHIEHKKETKVISVDIPSGWDVELGDAAQENGVASPGIRPHMLVSLTAPKLCAKKFTGPHHFLGGRFVPPAIVKQFNLKLPPYPSSSMCVRIGKPPSVDISSLRENYVSPELLESKVSADPFDQFKIWFDEALGAGLREPNAMALSTIGKDGKPSSRIVLLKGFDKQGFVWYTNYASRKARELSENPNASLLFHWNELNREVRIEGIVTKVSEEESEKYFHSRPRGSQLGAVVSKQSTVLPDRSVIYNAYKELEQKYCDGKEIPKPEYWGGYRLTPTWFEFWQGQTSRLHDRLQYTPREVEGKQVWQIERLSP
ncbi:pyridoxine/pyridoxamine 5'-phosphate oxidase 1 [Carex littledalei]|uniref:NAD(P)H-hydrate epimerase n=1 Tax=Carex littledalei TaxID=544730 RepID=A0A833QX57_9POAL|nr:pyridoxine/pyridoxamine 5'-phosphate oxidase 1 [Carex littledalei]